jgi:hypothetical protein
MQVCAHVYHAVRLGEGFKACPHFIETPTSCNDLCTSWPQNDMALVGVLIRRGTERQSTTGGESGAARRKIGVYILLCPNITAWCNGCGDRQVRHPGVE